MKFRIYRTSCKTPPCQEAVYDEEKKRYYIEIKSLKELMSFIGRHRTEIIINSAKRHNGYEPTIEIYDDYRE